MVSVPDWSRNCLTLSINRFRHTSDRVNGPEHPASAPHMCLEQVSNESCQLYQQFYRRPHISGSTWNAEAPQLCDTRIALPQSRNVAALKLKPSRKFQISVFSTAHTSWAANSPRLHLSSTWILGALRGFTVRCL